MPSWKTNMLNGAKRIWKQWLRKPLADLPSATRNVLLYVVLFSITLLHASTAQSAAILATTTTTITTNNSTVCLNTAVTFTAAVNPVAATGLVEFYDGDVRIGAATLNSGSATFTTSSLSGGTHTITARYVGSATYTASMSSGISQTIKSIATPVISGKTAICAGDTLYLSTPAVAGATYKWTGPNGFSSTLQNPVIPAITLGSAGTYSLTVTSNGCSSTAATISISVNSPITNVAWQQYPFCGGVNVIYKLITQPIGGDGTYTYQWYGKGSCGDNTPGGLLPGETNTSFIPTTTDCFWLQVSSGGCTYPTADVGTTTRERPKNLVSVPPTCSITGVTTICPEGSAVYTAPAGMTKYSWTITGNAVISGATNQSTVTVIANPSCGTFKLGLSITNESNCSSSCTSDIAITDVSVPVWSTAAGSLDRTIECSNTAALQAAQLLRPVATDNCSTNPLITKTTGSFVAGTCPSTGTYTNTFIATDKCGNVTSVFRQVITIVNTLDLVLPAEGASTVSCFSQAVTPALTPVYDQCGNLITPSSPTINSTGSCGGTRTYSYTYTNCVGKKFTWNYVYTISTPTFNLPAAGGSTVSCPADAIAPTPPTVTNNCGTAVIPSAPVVSADPACAGIKTFIYRYTNCDGTYKDWIYTYTISTPTFSLPANSSSTVSCLANATQPTPPSVTNNCGKTVTPASPVISSDPTCGGSKTYTFRYTNCDGTYKDWVFTYIISTPTFSVPANGSATVSCIANATQPNPPVVTTNCGNTITPGSPTVTANTDCGGSKIYTFRYTNCDGTFKDWSYTYNISTPTFSMPANESSTVSCLSDATQPTSPTITNSCGSVILPASPTVSSDPACAGSKIYTFRYTNCDGTYKDWIYTYNILAPTFTVPANGNSTVSCLSDATAPAPPSVTDNCGKIIVPAPPTASTDPGCAGNKVYTFRYTNCDGTYKDWLYTYTISTPVFSVPANSSSTVSCLADAIAPTPPSVTDNCGRPVIPASPTVGADPGCGGTKTYTFRYTNCDGTYKDWVYTYDIKAPTFSIPANGSSMVSCLAEATQPTPPTLTDNCGRTVSAALLNVSADPVCAGNKTYTFRYTNCDGTYKDWTFTYSIAAPTFIIPAAAGSTVSRLADAMKPIPPVVTTNCGGAIVPAEPIITTDVACGGSKSYTFRYKNCDGTYKDWVYTYSVSTPTFSIPAAGGSVVSCLGEAIEPTPPVVANNSGEVIVPAEALVTTDLSCGGSRTYTFRYTNCDGSYKDWVYTYIISQPTFSLPGNGGSTVSCLADATEPTPPVATDNCGKVIIPGTPTVNTSISCGGTKTYTFRYTNCDGTYKDWVYIYNISAPTFSLPSDDSLTVSCPANATQPTPPVVTDNCGNTISAALLNVSADPACAGNKTYTFRYTNCDGTYKDWRFTYAISAPTFAIPAAASSMVIRLSDATQPTPPLVTTTCGATIVPAEPVITTDVACGGSKSYSFRYTSCDGTYQDWVYTYTISTPTFTIPADGGSLVSCLAEATEPAPPVVTNNSGELIVPAEPVVVNDLSCGGTKTYTFRYTGCDGSFKDWVYVYTVSKPTFTLPADESSNVSCLANATEPTPPAVINNCGDVITPSLQTASEDPTCGGSKIYTFRYTNCDGLYKDWVYTYNVSAPAFSIPANAGSTVSCLAAAIKPIPPAVINNCGTTVSPELLSVTADPTCGGNKTYTYRYTNCDGSYVDWTYTYSIETPTFTLPPNADSTLACAADAIAPAPPTVMDNCGNTITPSQPIITADTLCGGSIAYTFRYQGCDGSFQDWQFNYHINPPVLTLPSSITSTIDCIAEAIMPTPPVLTDNCGKLISPSDTAASEDPICQGTKTYTFTYTNCDGTKFEWTYTYVLKTPTFELPEPGASTIHCLADAVSPAPPSVLDNCGNTIVPALPVISEDPLCSGTKTYSFTFTNCDGSTKEWTYTYTLIPATFIVPAAESKTVKCFADIVEPTAPVVNDACGNLITPSAPVIAGDSVCQGIRTYTFRYTGCDGSAQDWVYTFTIDPPTFELPADGSANVSCISEAVEPIPPVVTDQCGHVIQQSAPQVMLDENCIGTKSYVFNYTACDGSSKYWTFTYTIETPVLNMPSAGASTVACIADAVQPVPPSITDNCGNPINPSNIVASPTPGCGGTKSYTFIYTNCDGSSKEWVYTYTIEPPVFELPADQESTIECIADAVTPTPPTIRNNCNILIEPSSTAITDSISCGGRRTYTYTYTDCSGQQKQWRFTYRVKPTKIDVAYPAQTILCENDLAVYPIDTLIIKSNCNVDATITFEITGATTRSGTGVNASGTFNYGVSLISWRVSSACGIAEGTTSVTINPKTRTAFSQIAPVCQFTASELLPTTSLEGIPGTWDVSSINTSLPGISTYTFIPNADQCAIGTTQDIQVIETLTPSIMLESDKTVICPGGTVSFVAIPTNAGNNPSITWKINGKPVATSGLTYSTNNLANGDIVTVEMISSEPCVTTRTVTSNQVTIRVAVLANAMAASTTMSCEGIADLTVNAPDRTTFMLSYWKDNQAQVQLTNPESVAIPGTYYIKAVTPEGCSTMQPVSVAQATKPTAKLSGTQTICAGQPGTLHLQLTGTPPWAITYTDGAQLYTINSISSPDFSFSVQPQTNARYTLLSVTDSRCNSINTSGVAEVTISQTIPGETLPEIRTYAYIDQPLKARSLSNDYTYSWSPGEGLNLTSIYDPVFNSNKTTTYSITMTTPLGCKIVDTMLVSIINETDSLVNSNIFVPKAWTPNGDGHNDVLIPYLVQIKTLVSFRVYNRWGQKVFETMGKNKGWDGMYNGKPLPLDAYTWTVEAIGFDGKRYTKTGNSALLR